MATDKDELKDALAEFKECVDAEADNRKIALEDLEFAYGKQWPDEIKSQREREGRPCLTINRMPSFIRQVVNDGRQNKPSIKTHPVDSNGDPATASIIDGLIRNIEYTSGADVAYDTGLGFAVTSGIGYWRVNMDYAHDDTFDMDLMIQRISNPFSVYGDNCSTAADSSDWNKAFIVEPYGKYDFEHKWKGADKVDWKGDDYNSMPDEWREGESILVAERWKRSETKAKIVLLSDGRIVKASWLEGEAEGMPGATVAEILYGMGITAQNERETRSWKVVQQIMTGAEVLETNEWKGIYIPIVPVYGEEININGTRHFRSLIRDAKDPQRMFNYWRTTSTELVALAPKAPYVGPVGAFNTDADKWATANTATHAYVEYDGPVPPQRQPFTGPPAGALQEALNAADDMKSVMGLYDASLGARSNETSGIAINARKREGDTSTFHFIDNQARAIAHTGRILIDLIPHVYGKERIVRIMGVDKKPQTVPVNQPITGPDGQPQMKDDGTPQIYNLALGKYDLTVSTGPSFQTQREEAMYGMTELVRAFPQSAPIVAPEMAKNADWPNAEEMAEKLKKLDPTNGPPPIVQQMQQQMQQMQGVIGQLQQKLAQEQQDKAIEMRKLDIEDKNAETNRLKVVSPAMGLEQVQAIVIQTLQDILQGQQPPPTQGQPPQQPMQEQPPPGGFFSPEPPQA